VTENTFDAYLYQIVENKQKFISQIMTGKSPVRSIEDIDETALNYGELKALATGNPLIKEKMELDNQVAKLKLLKANHLNQRYALEDRLLKQYPEQKKYLEDRIEGYKKDIALYGSNNLIPAEKDVYSDSKFAGMTINNLTYTKKDIAGAAILETCKLMTSPEPLQMGRYLGFKMFFSFDTFNKQYHITLQGNLSHSIKLGADVIGNITRLNNVLAEMPKKLEYSQEQLKTLNHQIQAAKEQIEIPFEKEQELEVKSARLSELNILLSLDNSEAPVLDSKEQPNANQSEQQQAVGEDDRHRLKEAFDALIKEQSQTNKPELKINERGR